MPAGFHRRGGHPGAEPAHEPIMRCGRQGLEALSLAPGIPRRRIVESVALTRLKGQRGDPRPLLSAASILKTVPRLIAFIILRRRIMESVALTGLKG